MHYKMISPLKNSGCNMYHTASFLNAGFCAQQCVCVCVCVCVGVCACVCMYARVRVCIFHTVCQANSDNFTELH